MAFFQTVMKVLNPIQDGHFWICSRKCRGLGGGGGRGSKRLPFSKLCGTYPAIMKLGTAITYLKKIQKIYESRGTPSDFCQPQHFFTGKQQVFL